MRTVICYFLLQLLSGIVVFVMEVDEVRIIHLVSAGIDCPSVDSAAKAIRSKMKVAFVEAMWMG